MNPKVQNQKKHFKKGSWLSQEKKLFLTALEAYGKDWNKLPQVITTRSKTQIRSHAQKYFDRLEREFETKQILGEVLDQIKGPVNQRQYHHFLHFGKTTFLESQISILKQQEDCNGNCPLSNKKPMNSQKYQFEQHTKQTCVLSNRQLLNQEESSITCPLNLPVPSSQNGFFINKLSLHFNSYSFGWPSFYLIFVDNWKISYPVDTTFSVSPQIPSLTNCKQSFVLFNNSSTNNNLNPSNTN